jgi:uncharacterized membrane protein
MFETGFVRTEVWHALSVHFPIALLIFSTLAMLTSFPLKSENKQIWRKAASGLLYAGTIAAWVSIYTGNLADGIVSRKICDPTILKDHEIAAQTMTYLFTAAVVLNLIILFKIFRSPLRQIASIVILLLMIAGSGYVVYTGHLGASLVYQQGAGVYNHSVDCDDYN